MKFAIKNKRLISSFLETDTSISFTPISKLDIPPQPPLQPDYPFLIDLQIFLSGRQLLLDEIPFSFTILYEHYLHGYIQFLKGVVKENNHLKCNRCGTIEFHLFSSFLCTRCQQTCNYCRNCIMMGRVSECTPLLVWTGPHPQQNSYKGLQWKGELSPPQKEASDRIVDAIEKRGSLLVWAVCGAGKTEMLFEGIDDALSNDKRVAIATPRTDVVLELTPRLKEAFPSASISSLYGGSVDRHRYSEITITTTHQLFRFYRAFDVVIVDEVDAFPYSADQSLQFAVKKAMKEKATNIFLTATPQKQWQIECNSGKRNHIIIPARYHRQPIPIPRFEWCGNWKKKLQKNYVPGNIRQWVEKRVERSKQALIFFPKIHVMEQALPLFREFCPMIDSVHSEDPKRKEKVMSMRNGDLQLLLTTTILERGVTIPNIDVAVVGAEDQIFTESALVQIAGRVGRSAHFPTGDIVFFHYGKTKAMIEARNQLLRMNRLAAKRGLIDE